MTETHRRQIAVWLLTCCALVFAMVVLGGVTRLTGSGLSMVDWNPVTGIVPPITDVDWETEFAAYQTSPEYQKINRGMGLSDFKQIFWFEFAHRVLGRSIGIVFLLPFLYFLIRRRIDRTLAPKLAVMFVLGALQGLLGWYMVKSGLVDNPHVSQYRLTAHLMAAVLIYGYMLWVAMELLEYPAGPAIAEDRPGPRRLAIATTALVVLTIASGGFVAGTKAGFTYNTFPLMGERWIPEGILSMSPAYLNFFENVATVQFDHRLLAMLTLLAVIVFWFRTHRLVMLGSVRTAVHLLLFVAAMQVLLGILTLLSQVPVVLGAAHQGGALVLLTVALVATRGLSRTETLELPFAWHSTQTHARVEPTLGTGSDSGTGRGGVYR